MCLVEEEWYQSRYARNANTNKNEARLAEVEPIKRWVDQWKDFEEGVVDAWTIWLVIVKQLMLNGLLTICECSVDIGEQDGRIFNHDFRWLD